MKFKNEYGMDQEKRVEKIKDKYKKKFNYSKISSVIKFLLKIGG